MSNTTSNSNFTESTVVSVASDEMATTLLNESLRATFETLTRNLTNTVTEIIPVSDIHFRSQKFYQHCADILYDVPNESSIIHAFERIFVSMFDSKTLDWLTHKEEVKIGRAHV